MKCKKCNGTNIQKYGFVKLKNQKIQQYYCKGCNYRFYYSQDLRPICKDCHRIIEDKPKRSLYCESCTKLRKIHNNKKYMKKNKDKIKEKRRIRNSKKPKYWRRLEKKVCRECNKIKSVVAFDLCQKCYARFNRLNKKLSSMSDFEKQDYLINRGLLEEKKKEWTIENIKKDLGEIGKRNKKNLNLW